jgi:hypothetical protein
LPHGHEIPRFDEMHKVLRQRGTTERSAAAVDMEVLSKTTGNYSPGPSSLLFSQHPVSLG